MVLYKIEWKQSAKKELKKLGKETIPRVIQAVESLSSDPYSVNSRKLKGSKYTYRLKVGNYRIVYTVQSKILLIEVIRVGHRKKIYKKLFKQ